MLQNPITSRQGRRGSLLIFLSFLSLISDTFISIKSFCFLILYAKGVRTLCCWLHEQEMDRPGLSWHADYCELFEPGATPLPTGHSTGLNYRPISHKGR